MVKALNKYLLFTEANRPQSHQDSYLESRKIQMITIDSCKFDENSSKYIFKEAKNIPHLESVTITNTRLTKDGIDDLIALIENVSEIRINNLLGISSLQVNKMMETIHENN